MSQELEVEKPPSEEMSPSDLLVYITCGDETEKRESTKTLFNRFKIPVFNRLKKAFPDCDLDKLTELVLITFQKAIRKADNFRQEEGEPLEKEKNRFLKWLYVIAVRTYYNWIEEEKFVELKDENFWRKKGDTLEEKPSFPTTPEIKAVESAIEELSERDASILRAYLYFRPDIDNPQAKMPRKALKELADAYETTPENIRTIVSRAKKKVRAKLAEKGITYESA